MCQDNVTIHMINNFYCTGRAWWYNDTAELRKMCEEGKKATPTMCGRIAPDLNMSDTAGNMHRLYDNLGKNLTILFFYDPTCGHCKEVIPVVNAVFQKTPIQRLISRFLSDTPYKGLLLYHGVGVGIRRKGKRLGG